jgi:TPR repeat protein
MPANALSQSIVRLATLIASAAIIGAGAHSPCHAKPADIAICDRLASLPEDRDRASEFKGNTNIVEVEAALKACKAAAAMPEAPRRIAFQLGRAYEFKRLPAEAAKAYRNAAERGSTAAMVGLGALLLNGARVKTDAAAGRRWLEKAADAGDALAMSNLGSVYGAGIGVAVDVAAARSWYAKAVAANSSEAMYQLGLMTQDGDGAPSDDAAAKALFEQAAALDHADALERLGAYAETGRAGPKDEKTARAYYQRAAALGNDDAAAALKRLQCPFSLKSADGKVAGKICFDGNSVNIGRTP